MPQGAASPKMQLPSVERIQGRPPGADGVAPVPSQVIPVAPVNPATPEVRPVAGVVNDINPAVQARVTQAGEAAQLSQPDPLRGGSQADNSQRDWTQRSPQPQKVEEPPKEPLTQLLIEHVHAMWQASAKAVEVLWQQYTQAQNPAQQQNLQQSRNQIPTAVPGVLAKEVLTYSPNKVQKNEASEASARSDGSV